MGRYALPNDFQNVTIVKNLDPSYANAVAVNFQLENNNDGTYRLTVDTDAQDLILYPFPPEVGSGSFVTEHEIGRDPGDYVPYTKINGTRENKTDKIIPNFHVEQFVNGIDNVYFDDRGLLSRDCPVSFTYSLHTDDDYSCYEGTLDVKENILDLISGLETAGEPVVNKVNVKEWEITGYDVNGLNIDDVIGERRTDGDLFDNNYIISFSQNPGDIVTNVAFDPSWTLVEDQIVNASNLFGSRKYLDADTLNRTGGLPEEYISTYYPAVSPSDYTKNMYFIASNLVKSDNPAVVIHPQTEGSYNVRVLGSDGRDYRGLDIGTIVYSGKGLKTNDLFIINKTESVPKKLVAIYGEAEDDYALSFLDRNGNWKEIPVYGSGGDILTWWDVTGLNGLYTVRLISRMGQKMNADFIDVYIGNVVNAKDVGVILTSAGGQSKLIFPEGSVTSDTLVTVDEMPFDKVRDIAVLPDIDPVGRVVKFGPAGMSFTHLPDDVLPQVQFTYHRSELEDVYNPLELRIWFLNDEGKLEELPTIKAVYDENDNPLWSDDPAYGPGGNFDDVKDNYAYLRAFGVVTHFSCFLVLEGMRLEAPEIDQNDFSTGETIVNISGHGVPFEKIRVYVTDTPVFNPAELMPVTFSNGHVQDDGSFYISQLQLPYEGYNFVFIGYETDDGSEYAKLVVKRDTVSPVVTISSYNPYISPNGDRMQDKVTLSASSNEDGKLKVQVFGTPGGRLVFEREYEAAENREIAIPIEGKDTAGYTLNDGSYDVQFTLTDLPGNTAYYAGFPVYVDNTYPDAEIVSQTETISPENQDGLCDTAVITLAVDEPVVIDAWIGNFSTSHAKRLADRLSVESGSVTLTWNGKDASGEYAKDRGYFLTITLRDRAGNSNELQFYDRLTVVDNTAPGVALDIDEPKLFVIPGLLTFFFEVDEESDVTAIIYDPSQNAVLTFTNHYEAGTHTFTWDAVESLEDGNYIVTLRAADDVGNHSDMESDTIELTHDITPPVLYVPDDVSSEATGYQTEVDIGEAYSEDQSPPVTIFNNAPDAYPLGTTKVTWTAFDRYGNTSTAIQHVTVQDTTPPLLIVPPDIVKEADAVLTSVDTGEAWAYDIFPVSITYNGPQEFPPGLTEVLWVAEDENGNVSSGIQKITVVDTTPPVLHVPDDITIETDTLLTPVDLGEATAVDIFPVTITNNAPELFPSGTTIINWKAVDSNGNTATGEQKVIIYTCTLKVSKDSFIHRKHANANEGSNPFLTLHAAEKNRILVAFDLDGLRVDGLKKASLVLTVREKDNGKCWHEKGNKGKNRVKKGIFVTIHKVLSYWEEGNGWNDGRKGKKGRTCKFSMKEKMHHFFYKNGYTCKPGKYKPHYDGTGSGVTWNCAVDTDISNNRPDGELWYGGTYIPSAGDCKLHENDMTGEVAWDVTRDIIEGVPFGWLIKKGKYGQNEDIEYYSKEGAERAGNPGFAPKLLLEYE